ncbi:nuclear transport factor 2 family protein [Nocardia nova]|uniref:Nuclear transport factor 2 family protein n=1 Tax=Nocardia nova TaxID=37330 RepID=A0A2S6ASA6_9NOCA|nr:nuclear transport factor 2 family protein [Nocardia nova]PPJ29638.1 nuclear transport factor 2 family protein [Nocardia nova]PPJ38073.1 nuclear transport factor 2 family protein [Nocardia nova]
MRDLETLNAIEDIRYLEARYARYADEKRWEDLAGLFTEDGWFRPQDADGTVIADMQGRADIAAQLGAHNSGDDVQPLHQLLTHEIDIESDTEAKAIWAMADLIFRGDRAIPEPQPADTIPPFRVMRGWGHYHVTYRKIDGQWLIDTRRQTRTRLEFTF